MPIVCVRRAATARNAVRLRAMVRSNAPSGANRRCDELRKLTSRACCVSAYAAAGVMPQSFCTPKAVESSEVAVRNRVAAIDANADAAGVLSPFRRLLHRLANIIRYVLRALTLMMAWSPVAVSGCVVATLANCRVLPESWSAELQEAWWGFLLKVIERSGPTFIKAAQWVSTRRDSFPEVVCNRLGKLHTFTKSRPLNYGEDALDVAFGPSWRRYFELEEKALGSGCVAQDVESIHQVPEALITAPRNGGIYVAQRVLELIFVRAATLASTSYMRSAAPSNVYKGRMIGGPFEGRQIAVKVVDRRVKGTVERDLALMRAAADVLELIPRLHWLSLGEAVDEFGKLMKTQLDLRHEARSLERFRHDFKDDPSLVFPGPVYPWVTESVLVEEFKEGVPISKFYGKEESRRLASMGLQMFLRMVFINNFIHGDLHPGNLLVGRQADSEKLCLVILDAGIVSELDETDRKNFVDLFYAIVVGDGKLAGRLMIERARNQRCTDPEGFCAEVDALVQKARSSGLRLGQIQAGELLSRMFSLCMQHEVKLESKFSSVVLAIAVLEGVGRSLDPDCNILKASLPVVARATIV